MWDTKYHKSWQYGDQTNCLSSYDWCSMTGGEYLTNLSNKYQEKVVQIMICQNSIFDTHITIFCAIFVIGHLSKNDHFWNFWWIFIPANAKWQKMDKIWQYGYQINCFHQIYWYQNEKSIATYFFLTENLKRLKFTFFKWRQVASILRSVGLSVFRTRFTLMKHMVLVI